MNKVIHSMIALCVAIALSNVATSSSASSSSMKATNSGTCTIPATWKVDATRSGALVSIAFVATPLTPRSIWNMNTSWTGANIVTNASLTADSKGRVTYRVSKQVAAKTTIYLFLDQGDTFTCVGAVTI